VPSTEQPSSGACRWRNAVGVQKNSSTHGSAFALQAMGCRLLLALFLASWGGQFVSMLIEVGNEASQHGQPFSMDEFWPRFFSATFENWQSEWLQLLVQAVVLLGMKHVLFKADALDMEQVQLDLAEIKEHLGIPSREEWTVEATCTSTFASTSGRERVSAPGRAPPAGLEPATRCLEGSRSLQLSYRGSPTKVQLDVDAGRNACELGPASR
jgi:hypothetical protein